MSLTQRKRVFGEAHPSCTLCPLHETSDCVGLGSRKVSSGSGSGKVLLVFSGPSGAENTLNSVGHGRYHELAIKAAERWFPEADVYVALATRCHAGWSGASSKPKDPPATALRECHRYLREDIRALQPDIIIPIGKHAIAAILKQTLGNTSTIKQAGRSYSTEYGCKAVPVQTPAWALFDPTSNGSVWERAWQEARSVWLGKGGTFKEYPWTLYQTREEVEAFYSLLMRKSSGRTLVTYDYETLDLDHLAPDNDFRMVGYTWDGETAHVVPLSKHIGWQVDLHTKWLKTECPKGFHTVFELKAALAAFEMLPSGLLVDLKMLAYLDNENRSVSLDNLTAEFLPEMYGFKRETEQAADDGGWRNLGFGPLAERCAHDVIAQHKLVEMFRGRLPTKAKRLYSTVIEGALKSISRMWWRGWKVNRKLVALKAGRWSAESNELLEEMRADPDVRLWAERYEIDPDEVKFTSRTDHLPRLLSALGVETGEYQENGLQATSAKLVRPQAHKHPIVPKILKLHRLLDLRNKFGLPVLKWSERDGLLHPGYNLGGKVNPRDAAGTVTMRLSSKDPNVMNYPPEILPAFTSRFEGGQILARDYDQLELRVMAYAARDEVFLAEFAKPDADPHQANADALSQALGRGVDRFTGKLLNFAIAYGGGVKRIMTELGCDEATAESLLNAFWAAHPRLKALFSKWRMSAATKGVIPGLFGQDLHTPDALDPNPRIRSHAMRRAGNFPIQNGGAVFTAGAMSRVDDWLIERGFRSVLIAQLHDALYVDVYPGEAEAVNSLMVEAMEEWPRRAFPWFDVPLTTDSKIGRTMAGDTLRLKKN